ncbi:MAG: alpha/beta hydrolase [Gemmatimonadales bacterium]
MGRRLAYVGAGVVAAVVLFLLGGRLMLESLERQLIYFPTRVREDAPTPHVQGASVVEEVWLEAPDGVRVHGIYAGAEGAFADLLFFHGNAGDLYDRLDNVSVLVTMGLNVLIMDYRGYGKSEGKPSEGVLYEDGMLAYRYLTEERGVDPARLVIFGRSLGGAVAIELATRQPAAALVAESSFTSAQDLAKLHYSFLPGMLIGSMTHKFDSISKVPDLRSPALFIHGEKDTIVPARMGRRLYEAAAEPKDWYEVRGADHNDMLMIGGAEYFRRLIDFVKRYVDTQS